MNRADIFAAAVTLFFIMDPLGNIPVFNAVLAPYTARQRSLIVVRELLIALAILFVFLFAGTAIMGFLGLTQPSLSLAGGILLFIIALRMIFPRERNDAAPEPDPFIVPLAVPMVAGPSTIAVLLLLTSSEPGRMLEWSAALLLAWSGTFVILAASPWLLEVLGHRGLRALERLTGMLLILLAVQMFLDGLAQFLTEVRAAAAPGLTSPWGPGALVSLPGLGP